MWILLLVVAAAIGAGVYFLYNSDALVKDGIETYGSEYLGTDVKVTGVRLSFAEGSGRVTGLEVAQPPGFEGDSALRVQSIDVGLNAPASTAELVVIDYIAIDGAELLAIARGAEDNSFQALLDNLQRDSDRNGGTSQGSMPKFVVSRFDFTNASAKARIPFIDREVTLAIPDVRITDIGGTAGATAEEVAQAIVGPITASATRAVSKAISDAALERAGDELKDRLGGALDKLRGLGHPTD